jgi:hypothetical protein
MNFHPICLTFDPLPKTKRASLRASIKRFGCRVAVVTWNDSTGKKWVMDGRHRVELCDELGCTYPVVIFKGSEEEAIAFAESSNNDRRHQTAEEIAQRIDRVAELRRQGQSLRVIAEIVGTSKSQVERDVEAAGVPPSGTPEENSSKTQGKDGKTYPKRPKTSSKKTSRIKTVDAETNGQTHPKEDDKGDAYEGEPDQIKDALGHDVPGAVREVFEAMPRWEEIETLMRRLQKLVDEASKARGGEQLRMALHATGSDKTGWTNKSEGLNKLKRDVRGCRPYTICPDCKGQCKPVCKGCSGRGWMSKHSWDTLEESRKAALA